MQAYDYYAAKEIRNRSSRCAACGRPTQLIDLFTLESTGGPARHAKGALQGRSQLHRSDRLTRSSHARGPKQPRRGATVRR